MGLQNSPTDYWKGKPETQMKLWSQNKMHLIKSGWQNSSQEQPLKADTGFRIIGKTVHILLKGNPTMECQFSGSTQLQGELGWE